MKQVAPPYPEIPREELAGRVARAQEWMVLHDLDAFIVLAEENLIYYTGFRMTFDSPLGFFRGAVIPRQGDPILVIPHIVDAFAHKSTWLSDIRAWGGASYWGKPRDPIKLFADTVESIIGPEGKLGMEQGPGMFLQLSYKELQQLMERLDDIEPIDVTPEIWAQRAVKTEWEVEVYRTLSDITVKGFRAGLEALGEGVTEREILQVMWQTFVAEGAYDTPMHGQLMIRSGQERYDMMCARPVDRKLQYGDQIMLDSGPCYKGYVMDIQRQSSIGPPNALQRQLYEQSRAGFRAALETIQAGVSAGEIRDAAANAMLQLSPDTDFPLDFFGHGLGLCNHEPPYLVPDNDMQLKKNMVLSVEVPAYDLPEFRVLGGFLEDGILVTEQGYENLTGDLTHDLWITE